VIVRDDPEVSPKRTLIGSAQSPDDAHFALTKTNWIGKQERGHNPGPEEKEETEKNDAEAERVHKLRKRLKSLAGLQMIQKFLSQH
jgi:hypothetical protein